MYTYTFNGKVYSAETLPELQTILESQGFTGDVIEFFNNLALENLEKESQVNQEDLNQTVELPVEDLNESSEELLEEERLEDLNNDGLEQLN
jgi:hypothetical protein